MLNNPGPSGAGSVCRFADLLPFPRNHRVMFEGENKWPVITGPFHVCRKPPINTPKSKTENQLAKVQLT